MDPVITVSLTLSQWNAVGGALPELPMKIAQPLLSELGTQIQAQLDELKAKAETEAAEVV